MNEKIKISIYDFHIRVRQYLKDIVVNKMVCLLLISNIDQMSVLKTMYQ